MATTTTAPGVQLRKMPESVTLSAEQYLDLLAHLRAFEEIFDALDGNCCDGPASLFAMNTTARFDEGVLGEIADSDGRLRDPWELDPIRKEAGLRGDKLAADVLKEMAQYGPTFGFNGVLPSEFNVRHVYAFLWDEWDRLRKRSEAAA